MSKIWIAVVLGVGSIFVSDGVNGERLVVHEGNDYTLSCNLTAKMMDPSSAVRSVIWLFKRSHGGARDVTLAVWKRKYFNQSFPTQASLDQQYEKTVSAVGHNGYFTLLVSNASVELHDGRFNCVTRSETGKENVNSINVVVSYGPQLQLNGSHPTVWANTSSNILLHLSVVAVPTPKLVCEHTDRPSDHSRGVQVVNRTASGRTHHFSIRIQPTTETDFGAYDCTASNEAGSVSVLLSVLPDRRPDTPLNITVIANSTTAEIAWILVPYMDGMSQRTVVQLDGPELVQPAVSSLSERIVVEDLQPNTIYNVRLETVNSFGHASGPSNWITFRTAAASAELASAVAMDESASSKFITVIAAVGSVLLVAAVVVCLAMLVVRRRKHRLWDLEMITVRGSDRPARGRGAVPQPEVFTAIAEHNYRDTAATTNANSVFGRTIEELCVRDRSFGVPDFVRYCIAAIEATGLGATKDLYWVAGNLKDVLDLRQKVDASGKYECLRETEDVTLLASLLKLFFSELPEPLLNCFVELVDAVELPDGPDKVERFCSLVDKLLPSTAETLRMLLQHLNRVADLHSFNLMDRQNLANSFAAALMRSDEPLTAHTVGAGLIAAKCVRDTLKPEFKADAAKRSESTARMSKWISGKPVALTADPAKSS
ncbi:putative WW domain-containing protein [Hypsibius exemplaris]|uniref:WW domain-containing protein n=1 Tax=Hypsibius exemplaris TaxID=2072580 RepID=A0A1W0WMN1_HYPEX|nr:putative WW domain-containing protein [Hypsibius exemplaris]